ncbi:MAG: FAD-binding protein [Coriobacteriales bacterium]|jgi:succinate dehydrogenase/fumarate reductase flavoprotein subunit|nr:FAD-binding protein [Coriobacteriales bacterium]
MSKDISTNRAKKNTKNGAQKSIINEVSDNDSSASEQIEPCENLSRRGFLQGISITAASVATLGILGGCSPKEDGVTQLNAGANTNSNLSSGANSTQAGQGVANGAGNTLAATQKWSPQTAPAPIADADIVQTIEADVVIVGAGAAGIVGAYTAIQSGASVALLQNSNSWVSHGWCSGAINTKYQKEQGVEFNVKEVQAHYAKLNGGKADERVLKVFMDNSGETIDWLMSETKEIGFVGLTGEPPFAHMWEGQQVGMLGVIMNKAIEAGVQVHYDTEGVQLIKDGKKIVGVIGNRTEGTNIGYVKFLAKKGVLLATGDYGNDPEMVEAFAPFCVGLDNTYVPRTNLGGGHKMALWAGAAIDKAAHAPMIHFDPSPLPEGDAPFSGIPWLAVNLLGERFQNEDTDYPYIVNQCVLQPESTRFQICDSNYAEHWNNFGGEFMRWSLSGDNQAEWDDALKRGAIVQADTLDELASMLALPKETFLATVNRYNELVEKGTDDDFGKNPEYLKETKIEAAPFYGIKRVPGVLTIVGGLHVNQKLQVLDLEEQPMQGLYAAGNVSGNFFGNDYPLWLGAASCGRAVTFGRYAVKSMLE